MRRELFAQRYEAASASFLQRLEDHPMLGVVPWVVFQLALCSLACSGRDCFSTESPQNDTLKLREVFRRTWGTHLRSGAYQGGTREIFYGKRAEGGWRFKK